MERTLTTEERIRRAEEIYYKRKGLDANRKSTTANVSNKRTFSVFKKMILQIIICILIYVIFYMIQNTNYIFSEHVINKTKEILSYDINIKDLYEQGINYLNSLVGNVAVDANIDPKNENILESNETNAVNSAITNEIQTNEVLENSNTNSTEEQNIGGENIEIVEEIKEETKQLSQMQQDAKDIIETKSLIIPLKGTITSRYGLREPETPTVPKNHTGIDIAVNEGTVFIASMEGVVEKVSSEGDLGNHFSIVNDDVATVYAHCKTIYVKNGDKVLQGQKIGEVGSTGNSTGPHLHFEIKKDNRYVDPDLILEF